jgi:hypothetical protein
MSGNVVVRFSVEDQEKVRAALQSLGKEGQSALDKMNAAGQSSSKGVGAVSNVVADLKGKLGGLAGSLGTVGDGLVGLGPLGLVAAGAIGGVLLAFQGIKEGAKEFGAYASGIKDLKEQTGLAAAPLQALLDLAQQHGVTYDQATAGVVKFAQGFAEARKGSGELYNELKRLDPALAEQFANARTLAEALEILAKAETKTDQATQALINRFAFGKGAAGFGPTLLDLAGKGGFGPLTESALKSGAAIENGVIDKMADAANAAERKSRLTQLAWNGAYAAIYEKWKDFKTSIGLGDDGTISLKVAVAIRGAVGDGPGPAGDELRNNFAKAQAEIAALMARPDADRANVQAQIRRRQATQENIKRQLLESQGSPMYDPSEVTPIPRADPRGKPRSDEDITNELTRQVQTERQRLAILGDVAGATELVNAKEQEVNLARRTGAVISDDEAARVKQGAALRLNAAEIAIRTQLGVATADERRAQKEQELNLLVRNGKLTDEQRAQALALYNKELETTIRAEEVRKSNFPQLTQFIQDATDRNKQLDQGMVTTFGAANSSLVDFEMGTKSGTDALKDFGNQFARTALQIVNQMIIMQPIALALRTLLGSFGGGFSVPGFNPIAGVTGHADGGLVGPGNWGIVGERGPELIRSSSSGTHVFSNSQSRNLIPGFARGGFLPAPGAETDEPEAMFVLRRGMVLQ